jgi:uroporphyrinogen III methyltransferase/synthase
VNFRVGTRQSRLALIQTGGAVDRLRLLLPGISFEIVPLSTPGDRDQAMDLRQSPPDFFTHDLDQALIKGNIDIAIHSAKDVPDPVPEGLDWFWLPWREDPRDVIVIPPGRSLAGLSETPRIGVSSARRERYCRDRFPGATVAPIRGNIEDRLLQLDRGDYDAVVMAGAALLRLGLGTRITQWIPLAELATPEGQGVLAVTFRANDARLLRLRSLFVNTVTFVGAGVGAAELCTLAGIKALSRCEVCLYDSLLELGLLDCLPADAVRIDVGKRCGAHGKKQEEINELLVEHVLRGRRVVRLKGGDPGLFGRLVEEVDALGVLHLPYHVIPGVSSLNAATTGTGMLLTRRGVSRGFCVMSARGEGGRISDVSGTARRGLPCIFFMSVGVVDSIVAQLLSDGIASDTPAALVFNAGADDECILRAPLAAIAARQAQHRGCDACAPPGLFIVGDIARYSFRRADGALQGRRVLLTCSEALLDRAAYAVRDQGGIPVRFPLIRLVPAPDAASMVASIDQYDWVVLTSPSAVRILFRIMRESRVDIRHLPRIIVSGAATARELLTAGVHADLCPEAEFGAHGLLRAAHLQLQPGAKVMRLRSDAAGPDVAQALRESGAQVIDAVLYSNELAGHHSLPDFNAVIFASSSAAAAFMDQWGTAVLSGKVVTAIGQPTVATLDKYGVADITVPQEATIASAVFALAGRMVAGAIREISP